MDTKLLSKRIAEITVFTAVKNSSIMEQLFSYLKMAQEKKEASASLEIALTEQYSRFLHALYEEGADFGRYLREAVLRDDNVYVRCVAAGKTLPACIQESAAAELALFSELTALDSKELAGLCGSSALFDNTYCDFSREYGRRILDIGKYGYGIFSTYGMFRISDGKIVPVQSADRISMDDFVGYAQEREQVLENTKALVAGKPAANVLLCGDAGTGKSSTVKAVANALYSDGVRLIELRKDQLSYLSEIMGMIRDNPLKFIVFIDDLSFNRNDDTFSMLKAALEGSASAKASNAVIYATSNRRHMVKETFSDRGGDDVHRKDTMQELLSLSERFGLVVLFQMPSKKLYLEIVRTLAEKKGISISVEELETRAEAYALRKGGRNARAAEQFTNSLV